MALNALLVMLLVAANGFFVAAEFALVKIRIGEIKADARSGSRSAGMVANIVEHLDSYLSACQLGITLASLGLGWVGEPLVARSLEPVLTGLGVSHDKLHYFAFPVAFSTITFLHITAGEQVPKIMAIKKYKPTTFAVAVPLMVFYRIFRPFIWVLNTASNLILRLVGIQAAGGHAETTTEDELRLIMLESAEGGHVSRRERLMMENVLDLEDRTARSCMLPRSEIVFVNIKDPLQQQLAKVSESGHTRLPLCDGDLDHVIGVVHVKTMFQRLAGNADIEDLSSLAGAATFLPETLRLDDLLRTLQRTRVHLAFLVDEYGVLSGIITLENVLEQLVGPIQDEFDNEIPPIRELGPGRHEALGSMSISSLRRMLGLKVPTATAETIGGAIVESLGRIPKAGERIVWGRHSVTVTAASERSIRTVVIEAVTTTDDGEDDDEG
jgi:CBS domain containing-hemolysin-like protein